MKELQWGTSAAHIEPPFDVIVACDIMYILAAVNPLLDTLKHTTSHASTIYIAHGRNQQARDVFLQNCAGTFEVCILPTDKLDTTYQCIDVEVLRLKPL